MNVALTKAEFKRIWDEDSEVAFWITLDDIAACAQAWGVHPRPRTVEMSQLLYMVLKAAGTDDAEDYRPED